jgi:hypothetical protein
MKISKLDVGGISEKLTELFHLVITHEKIRGSLNSSIPKIRRRIETRVLPINYGILN